MRLCLSLYALTVSGLSRVVKSTVKAQWQWNEYNSWIFVVFVVRFKIQHYVIGVLSYFFATKNLHGHFHDLVIAFVGFTLVTAKVKVIWLAFNQISIALFPPEPNIIHTIIALIILLYYIYLLSWATCSTCWRLRVFVFDARAIAAIILGSLDH